MKNLSTDYRPANIEFDVANSSILPDNLGKFETAKNAIDFIHANFLGVNQKISVLRFMDNFEKSEIRKEYSELLEHELPSLEKKLQIANQIFEQAKKGLSEAKEMVNATINTVKALSNEVKLGTKEITLDDQFTWRIPFNGNYYFFTFIDLQLKLAKVSAIPEHEKMDVLNSLSQNEKFINDNFCSEKNE